MSLDARVRMLNRWFFGRPDWDIMAHALNAMGRVAVVSSFGADSAVLLHMAARIDPRAPVLLVDTGRLFPETLAYRDMLADRLGLAGLEVVRPDPERIRAVDPGDTLYHEDPDACCALRKTEPLQAALAEFDGWVTGRKRYQTAERATLDPFEVERPPDAPPRIKVNPLAHWTADDVAHYIAAYDLPQHPLVAEGYPSIGCWPCTTPVDPGEDPRAGRWPGAEKTECGIHITGGEVRRGPAGDA